MNVRCYALLSFFVCTVAFGGCATEHSGNAAGTERSAITASSHFTTIDLDRPVHFTAADGAGLLVPVGQYVVGPTDHSHLRLIPEENASPLVVAAALQAHDIDIAAPFVLAFTEREDEPHVLLLLPDGRALDAVGSFSGIQSRDVIRTNRLYTLQAKTGTVRFGDGVSGRLPSAAKSSVSPSYRTGVGTVGNTGSSDSLGMFEVQTLMADRQRAEALAQSVLAAQNERFRLEYNLDRPGGDYAQRAERTPESCRALCSADNNCQAFTFVKPAAGVAAGPCFLKRTVPASVTNSCCISGKRKSTQEGIIGNLR